MNISRIKIDLIDRFAFGVEGLKVLHNKIDNLTITIESWI